MRKVIEIAMQRSRADTNKSGYRFRARNKNGFDYSHKDLKELGKEHNFKLLFDNLTTEEQKTEITEKYVKLGLRIVDTDLEVEKTITAESFNRAWERATIAGMERPTKEAVMMELGIL